MKPKKPKVKFNTSHNPQYFQGVLQLRNPNETIMEFVKNELRENKHKGVFVGKEKRVTNGLDLYLSSNHFTINLGNKLYKRFGGILKINEQLFTRNNQTSKDVYRMTIMYRPVDFLNGDIVSSGKKILKVGNVGKKLTGLNIATGKKDSIDYANETVEKHEVFKTTVSKVYPQIEVLHPETYQSVTAGNAAKVQLGEKVKVVLHNGVWIVD